MTQFIWFFALLRTLRILRRWRWLSLINYSLSIVVLEVFFENHGSASESGEGIRNSWQFAIVIGRYILCLLVFDLILNRVASWRLLLCFFLLFFLFLRLWFFFVVVLFVCVSIESYQSLYLCICVGEVLVNWFFYSSSHSLYKLQTVFWVIPFLDILCDTVEIVELLHACEYASRGNCSILRCCGVVAQEEELMYECECIRGVLLDELINFLIEVGHWQCLIFIIGR